MDVFGVNQPQLDSSRLGGMGARGDASDAGPPPKEWARPKRPKLDSRSTSRSCASCEEWLEVERIRQAPNRYQQAIDQDFYDGLQWGDQEAAELQERGQAPLVYNKTQPAVKWITGTEKRTRIDWKVLPRNEDGIKDAAIKTKLLKYVQDVNKSQFSRSRAFEDAVKVGVGWLESGIRADPDDGAAVRPHESWRNMLYDSTGCEYDLSDSRYLFRMRWVDLDIAQAMFPESMDELRQVSVYSDFADAQDSDEYYLGQLLQERSPRRHRAQPPHLRRHQHVAVQPARAGEALRVLVSPAGEPLLHERPLRRAPPPAQHAVRPADPEHLKATSSRPCRCSSA
jgi:hypothetical protein